MASLSSHNVARGVVAGVVSAAAGLGVAELVTALLGGSGSPILSVGNAFVDATPRWLKEFAIEAFGQNDKRVLLLGIVATIAVLAAAIGVLAQWRRTPGVAASLVVGLVPAVAALTRPDAKLGDALPAAAGALVASGFLWLLSAPHVQIAADGEQPAPSGAQPSRRTFLTLVGVAAAVAVAGVAVGRELARGRVDVERVRAALRLPAPSASAPTLPATVDVPGVAPYITANDDFYRIDTALRVPVVDSSSWRLRIHGMVENELTYTFDDLLALPLVERDVTLTCVSNEVGGQLVGNARWLGALIAPILADARPLTGADQVVSRSVDGMTIGTPLTALTDGRDAMLAVGMNGDPLPVEHGFPVRMVVPGLYGYVSACKWLQDLEITTFDAYDAYWVERGWVQQAPIKISSRIDTPRAGSQVSLPVTVGGVAWAQHTGIDAVEVRVDDGGWQQADLATEGSIDSWRLWSWTWSAATPGTHTLSVRAIDRDGTVQPGQPAEPFPSGATGWHTVSFDVD